MQPNKLVNMLIPKEIISSALLLSASMAQAAPVTIDFHGDYLGNAPVAIEDFNSPNVVTFNSSMYPFAYHFAKKLFLAWHLEQEMGL